MTAARTSREARKLFEVGRVCHSARCRHAVIVCMNCWRRGCRHLYRDGGYLNLETLTDAGAGATMAQLLRGHLLPLGVCQNCQGPIARGAALAALVKHIEGAPGETTP